MAHLGISQRYEIYHLKKQGLTYSSIAKRIGVHKSTISREFKRNSDSRNGVYKVALAQKKTEERHLNKPKSIRFTKEIVDFVTYWLKEDYSPEQIVGKSKRLNVSCVSIERIYQFIWNDKKQGGMLYTHLRTLGKRYQKRENTNSRRGQIADRVPIEQRPEIVDKKDRIGDLEIDLVIGRDHKGALLTINDRATGILKMAHLKNKSAKEVELKTIELLESWTPFIHTITSDNGKEFANHKVIAEALNIDFFFAKPYHSWQRGANENLNGLVRQYFPKKTNFESLEQQKIDKVVEKLNNRPRKRYNFLNPIEKFDIIINQMTDVAFIT